MYKSSLLEQVVSVSTADSCWELPVLSGPILLGQAAELSRFYSVVRKQVVSASRQLLSGPGGSLLLRLGLIGSSPVLGLGLIGGSPVLGLGLGRNNSVVIEQQLVAVWLLEQPITRAWAEWRQSITRAQAWDWVL